MVSLIDVMMLLLVIFMITAPLMQGGVDVKLPVADAKPLEGKSSMVITINAAGVIFVDRARVTYREFSTSFKSLIGSRAAQGVTVEADQRADWGTMARVLAVIRSAGVTNVGIVLEPEPPRPQ